MASTRLGPPGPETHRDAEPERRKIDAFREEQRKELELRAEERASD